jgi:short subunit dehydrogenase-like uncharacterized protein
MADRLLIYGAPGYTGELIAHEAVRRGLDIVVAGRNREKVDRLAANLGVEGRTFDLGDRNATEGALDGITVVLNVAGPFAVTAAPLLAASLREGVHYLDTTAELGTFLHSESAHRAAEEKGVMVMSGAGWDVVPSDTLATRTAARVDAPVSLRLALKIFVGAPGEPVPLLFSRGSITSALGFDAFAGSVRKDGSILRVEDSPGRTFDFGFGPEETALAPMGDLVTAWHSTGIPDIEVYVAGGIPLPTVAANAELPAGPSAGDRLIGRARVAAEVTGSDGTVARGIVDTPTGYGFTQLASVEIAARVLAGNFRPGFQSPSSAYGSELLTSIADSHFIDL